MQFYFAGSIRGGRSDVAIYRELIEHLKSYDSVSTEHVGDYSLSLKGQTHLSDHEIHDRDVSWLEESDLVIAEVTQPSLGVGYELALAVRSEIPVLALHRRCGDNLSAMIAGSSGIVAETYTTVFEAIELIDRFVMSRREAVNN